MTGCYMRSLFLSQDNWRQSPEMDSSGLDRDRECWDGKRELPYLADLGNAPLEDLISGCACGHVHGCTGEAGGCGGGCAC